MNNDFANGLRLVCSQRVRTWMAPRRRAGQSSWPGSNRRLAKTLARAGCKLDCRGGAGEKSLVRAGRARAPKRARFLVLSVVCLCVCMYVRVRVRVCVCV